MWASTQGAAGAAGVERPTVLLEVEHAWQRKTGEADSGFHCMLKHLVWYSQSWQEKL